MFQLYKIKIKYIRNLKKIDKHVMSVSPQEHKNNRLFLGILVMINQQQYCIPLSSISEKEKYKNIP